MPEETPSLRAGGGFIPVEGRRFPRIVGREFIKAQRVDLHNLPDGSLVEVSCYHLGASYTLEITGEGDQKIVYLWRSADCLKGPVDGIISYIPVEVEGVEEDRFLINKGVLQLDRETPFPYFRKKDGKLQKPNDTWIDTCRLLSYSTAQNPRV